ncbi:MAG: methyltransferase family protein [Bryobacteraceae bacterium]
MTPRAEWGIQGMEEGRIPEKRLSRFGIGPKTLLPSLIYALAAWAASRAWPDVFLLRSLPEAAMAGGVILMATGLLLWAAGVVTVMRAYNRDQLVTSGAFALVRHPAYAAWIVLVLPGLALYTGSWPLFLTPVIAYLIFKRLIHVEDEYLRERYGQAYLDYRGRVNEVIPFPRFWQKGR